MLERRDFNQFTARYPALRSAFIDMANERRRMNEGGVEETAEAV